MVGKSERGNLGQIAILFIGVAAVGIFASVMTDDGARPAPVTPAPIPSAGMIVDPAYGCPRRRDVRHINRAAAQVSRMSLRRKNHHFEEIETLRCESVLGLDFTLLDTDGDMAQVRVSGGLTDKPSRNLWVPVSVIVSAYTD